ncbi:clostripain-related cysteine peptidase [Prevotella fusca]|uniref:clostripain-related cysteine peptidase n=1 Tax=Prevotella fusca TaxID=589436 RepID=UPI000ADC505F|nr:clostripain-related cysteine peptidase [Prevotella fusca]
MKKIFLLLQLALLVLFASCSSDVPLPYPTPQPPTEAENTIFVYMPWSGSPGSLYPFFQKNLTDIKQAVESQGGLGDKHLIVFISDSPSKGSLINVKYQQGRCVDDTVAVFNNTLASQQLNSANWITTVLKRVQAYAPARSYSMIVGCHGMGWIPGNSGTRRRYTTSAFRRRDVERLPLTRWFGGDTYKTDISTFDKGIEQSGIGKMQYILFDDCYMSTIEVAYELRHSAKHIIACPTEIMAHGMPYDLLWTELSKSSPDYGSICDTFYNFYISYSYPYGTIGVIDCSQIDGMVDIMKSINHSGNLVSVSEDDVQIMDGYQPAMFFDMGDYVRKIAKNETALLARFERQLSLLVPYKRNTPSFFTEVRSPGVGDVLPINTYSGITISDLSSNTMVKKVLAYSHIIRLRIKRI